ncbi:MBL fold metallo-hydrolase [Rugosimonospora acidiphila]|uniref:MBL fold metallo-hydrolase n=1 Tax=Rugosimonospora acidiphila TaxID=556531 RepID=A0ABP9SLZ6_9ACTN
MVGVADQLPTWATLVRAPNPGPMTLEGTNTWVIRPAGVSSCVVVDPGPLDEGHLRSLAEHGPVAGILLTHGHADHVAGLDRLIELTGAAVMDESPGVRRIGTPGHTGDSACFLVDLDDQRAVLTGDTILGRGTTVVAHPDGNLGDYLRSLELLEGLGAIPVLPGHGPALTDCAGAARYYLEHRRQRLEQVRRAVEAGATTVREVVESVYADVDRSLWPYAQWSVRAQLEYLGVESSATDVRWDTS